MARKPRQPRANQRQGRSAAIAERVQSNLLTAYRGQSRDFYMLSGVIAALVIFGLIMVLSASYVDLLKSGSPWFSTFLKQIVFALLGFAGMTFAVLRGPKFFERMFIPAYGILVLVQISVSFIGKEVNGNKNWIQLLPGVSFQPSELFKVVLALSLAYLLSRNQGELDNRRTWVQALLALLLPVGIILLQKDLGTDLVILAEYIGLAILAGLPAGLVRKVALAAAILIPAALMLSSSRLPRIMAWLNPGSDTAETYNWQQSHGIWALAAGGFTGVGLGAGKMKWSWIPEVDNDFIFAVIGEELGMVGCLVVIVLFVTLIFTLVRIYQNTADLFARYYVLGVATWLAAQSFINIAVVLRLLPVLGVPLPLISQGGTSMVAVLIALGIVLGIERQNHMNYSQPVRVPRAAAPAKKKVVR